jgi:hypothetical protein
MNRIIAFVMPHHILKAVRVTCITARAAVCWAPPLPRGGLTCGPVVVVRA